jgi:membrane-associated phospholipid phosphatase
MFARKYFYCSLVFLSFFVVLCFLVSSRLEGGNLHALHLYEFDYSLFLKINESHYSPFLNQFMVWMTLYGKEVFWIATIILMFVFGGNIGKKVAVIMAICMIILIPLGMLAKEIVQRPRPSIPKEDMILSADAEYAFPSGHALIVSANAAVAIALFRFTRKQRIISMILVFEAAIVCVSRIYVGAHYPLDVIGGIFLGVGISLILIGLERKIDTKLLLPLKRMIR